MDFREPVSVVVIAMMVAGILAGFVMGFAAARKRGPQGEAEEARRTRLALALLIGTTGILILSITAVLVRMVLAFT